MSTITTEIVSPSNMNQLAKLEHALQMLAECRTVDEVKDVRDKAEAIRLYCKNAKMGLAAKNKAALLKIEAERRAGEMLAVMCMHGGDRKSKSQVATLNLPTLGITKSNSSRRQGMAGLPDDDLASYVESCQQMERELTSEEVFSGGRRAAMNCEDREPPAEITFERCAERLRSLAGNLECGVFDVRSEKPRSWSILDDIAKFRDLSHDLDGNWENDPGDRAVIAHFFRQCANEIHPASNPAQTGGGK